MRRIFITASLFAAVLFAVTLVEPRFHRARRFSQGLAAACVGSKWGFIHKTGKWAIPPQYDEARDFCEGLALVAVKDGTGKLSYGYIDTLGRTVVKPRRGVVSASPFSEGLASLSVLRAWYERLDFDRCGIRPVARPQILRGLRGLCGSRTDHDLCRHV